MTEALILSWEAVLQGAIRWLPVLGLAALTVRGLARRPARVRHAVWLLALASLAVLPLAGGRLPVGLVRLPPVVTPLFQPSAERQTPRASGEAVASSAPATTAGKGERSRGERADRAAGAVPGRTLTTPDGGTPATSLATRDGATAGPKLATRERGTPLADAPPWSLRLAAGWALVALLLLAYELLALVATGVLGRGASEVPPGELPPDLAMNGPHPAILSGGTDIPILFGLRRPRILLPLDWSGWPESWLRAVILHESAHAHRRDLVLLAVGRLIRAVFWFHPGGWLAMRELRREAEQATDERVLESGMDRFEYADALLGLARHLGRRRLPLAGLPMAGRGSIQKRLLRVVRSDPRQVEGASRAAWSAALVPITLASVAVATPVVDTMPEAWLERVSLPDGAALWQARCPPADTVCSDMAGEAVRLLEELDGGGAVAVQEVGTGRVAAYAFLDRDGSHPAVPAVPISAVATLPLAAAWWEAGMGDRDLPCPAVINLAGAGSFANTNGLDTGLIRAPADVVRMQCATTAIAMGWYLAAEVGPSNLQQAFARWGFAPGPRDAFWSGSAHPEPAAPSVPTHPTGGNATWTLAGSVHGTVRTTPLHVTGFLQAVANGGRRIPGAPPGALPIRATSPDMDPITAERLLDALLHDDGAGDPAAPHRRLVGIVGPALSGPAGGAGELFAGVLLDDRGAPAYAIAVWLAPGRTAPVRAGASRTLAERLLPRSP